MKCAVTITVVVDYYDGDVDSISFVIKLLYKTDSKIDFPANHFCG